MKNLLLIAFAFVYSFVGAQVYEWKKPEWKEFKLENGLTVYLNEDHSLPQCYGAVMVKAGAKDDPTDATGMAHYMEHMLFKGTEQMGTINWEKEQGLMIKIIKLYDKLGNTPDLEQKKEIQKEINEKSIEAGQYVIPNEMDRLMKGIGCTDINANTGSDRTMFLNTFPSTQIEKWLDMYAHRFHKPVFRGFQAELEVVYEEKNMYADMFQFRLFEEFNKHFFKVHPYGQQPLIGTMEHLKNPSLSKMYQFYYDWYVPSNMALVISGDFNPEQIMPMIKEKFGIWENRPVPEHKKWEEKPLEGRVLIEKKLTPIKLGLAGFRTVPAGHDDEMALELMYGLLSNASGTGLFDKLSLDNKLLAAAIFPMPQNDYGESLIFFVPKIVGQKLDEAEKLVMDELGKIAKGEFSAEDLEALKKQKLVEFMTSMESLEDKVYLIAETFGQNRNPFEALDFPEKLMKISVEDIKRVSAKYFGKDYLVLHSTMGFPKPEKIEKPGFKPVLANAEAQSPYAKHFNSIPDGKPEIKFIDFKSDIQSAEILKGIKIYRSENPINPVFSLQIKYGVGDKVLPMLKYASQLLNMAGAGSQDVKDFKSKMSSLGCNYDISNDESYLYVEIEGLEENMTSAVKMVYELLNNPNIDPKKIEVMYDGEKSSRQMEKTEPDPVAGALFDWVRRGEDSDYLSRLTLKEIKNLNLDEIKTTVKNAIKYERTIHYSGKNDIAMLEKTFTQLFEVEKELSQSQSPYIYPVKQYNENTIFMVDKPKASQSKIFFMINTGSTKREDLPVIEAFNSYFGGDFSGLVLQEVREYRSMAYSAGAAYAVSRILDKPSLFYGFIGTQNDKTNEAVTIFDSLVRFMPQKPERMDFIKRYLIFSMISERPNFRNITKTIERWKLKGYDTDPAKEMLPSFEKMTFDDIVKFENEHLSKKPMVISIVGNAKMIDKTALLKYGKIIPVKQKALFKD